MSVGKIQKVIAKCMYGEEFGIKYQGLKNITGVKTYEFLVFEKVMVPIFPNSQLSTIPEKELLNLVASTLGLHETPVRQVKKYYHLNSKRKE